MCVQKHRQRRELINKTCYNCSYDCKRVASDSRMTCINFNKGYSSAEYWRMIKEDGIKLDKLCNKSNLSLNTMFRMLNNKEHLQYKYRVALNNSLFEKHEYDEYVLLFEENEFGFTDEVSHG